MSGNSPDSITTVCPNVGNKPIFALKKNLTARRVIAWCSDRSPETDDLAWPQES